MPNDITRVFVPFASVTKSTIKGADGKDVDIRLVKGLMTDESLDLDDQRVDFDWAKNAATKWHTRWGNIREQHSSNAIGKSVELDVLEKQRAVDLTGKIVDPIAIVKTDEEILQGWSVGIKGARVVKDATAPNGRIVGGEIIEVSLVDHPANENCKVALVKSAKNGKLVDADQAVVEKLAAADTEKIASVESGKAAPASHGHLHTHNEGTDQEYQHDHGHDHADGLHDDGEDGDHQHDHDGSQGKDATPETEKAAPQLTGEQKQHNRPLGAALDAVKTLIQQEANEADVDFDDIACLTSIGNQLTYWASRESYETDAGVYLAAMPQVEKSLAVGDRDAAIAVLKAAQAIAKAAEAKTTTKEAPPVEPKTEQVVEKTAETEPAAPAVETPPADEPDASKQAVADSEKSIESVVTKAVEAAVKPLKDEIEKLKEKRAAAGGPILGASKLLSAPADVKGEAIKASLEDLKKAAENHPDFQVRQGARELLNKLAGDAPAE